MQRAFNLLFSTRTMAVFLLVFALSMAVGTFLEEIYNTATAKALIYEASWFEAIMILLILCFIGNIRRYHLWRRDKWPLLIFHFAFICIFIGGAISRYIGFEGMMSIREGTISNQIVSNKTFIKVKISGRDSLSTYIVPYLLAPLHSRFYGKFKFQQDIFKLKIIDYIPGACERFIKTPNGKPFIKIITSSKKGRLESYLKQDHLKELGPISIGFGRRFTSKVIKIYQENGKLYILSPFQVKYTVMTTGAKGILKNGVRYELQLRTLYQIRSIQWMVPEPVSYGILKYISATKSQQDQSPDAITIEISNRNLSKTLTFFGKKGEIENNGQLFLGDKHISIGYGSVLMQIPFALRLNRFELEYYPGSLSPSSFASELTIIDGHIHKNKRIFMNNVLNYKGYRFFQSGYDPDAKGTHLSINHDYWGTLISYIGYIMLSLGMFLTLFWPGTRFWKLKGSFLKISSSGLIFLIFLFSFFIKIHAQHLPFSIKKIELSEIVRYYPEISRSHLDKFNSCLVQDQKGRIKPIHTMALELLRKIYKQDRIGSWSASRWLLSIYQNPIIWTHAPFIRVESDGGDELLKITRTDKYNCTSLINLYHFDPVSNQVIFVLQRDYNKAFLKNPAQRNKYDKAIINLNERIYILSGILQGLYLRIFPIPRDPNHTWSSWIRPDMKIDPIFFKMINDYFIAINQIKKPSDWQKADQRLDRINFYQQKYGHEVLPSLFKVRAEIFYNKINIFYKVMLAYALLGFILLFLTFSRLFFRFSIIRVLSRIISAILALVFIIHTIGLGLRWYISGHAPWSNAYESATFISWCMLLAGWIFYHRSNFFIPALASLSATILLGVAHSNLMDPEITNLVPVLKSYWLIIHVAIITSSYGFFSIGAFIGLTVLILYNLLAFSKPSIYGNIIQELTIINEMTLTVGLFLLSVGTFLGGVWANESWGRYWSWDPKETWAFISIMFYAFVLHMRLIKGLRGAFAFNLASIISFGCIIMTYFGVNYYLSGLHSYAKGDPIPIPLWIYYMLSFISIIAAIAKYHTCKSFKRS